MNCTINDLNLSFDKDNRLRTTIGRVSVSDSNKAKVLASFFQDDNFKAYLSKMLTEKDIVGDAKVDLKNITENDYVNINQNKLGSLLNVYYIDHYHSVNNSKTNKALGRLNGFSSGTAKTVGLNYSADKIIDKYYEEFDKANRKSAMQIIAEVIKDTEKEFISQATLFANDVVNSDKYSKEAKEYAQKYLDVINNIKDYNEKIKTLVTYANANKRQIESLNGKKLSTEDTELKKSLIDKDKANNEEYKKLNMEAARAVLDRYVLAQNLVNLYTSNVDGNLKVRLRNFANLVAQMKGDTNGWFFQVMNTKRMTSIIKEFNNIGDMEEYLESQDENNDNIIDKYNGQDIDQTTKSWEDSLYKSFNSAISGKMRMILSRIPKLSSPYNATAQTQSIDTENELGVKTYMDAQFVTVQLFSFGDFSNVESMIQSIEAKANSIKELYGIGVIIEEMKNNKVFANYMFANFAKPLVHKTMCTINDLSRDGGIIFDYSNKNAFYTTKVSYDMINKLRATYNTQYDINDKLVLDNIGKNLRKDKITDNDINTIYDTLIKYFPNIKREDFDNFLNGNKDNKKESLINFVNHLSTIITHVGKLKQSINDAVDKANFDYKEAKKQFNAQYKELSETNPQEIKNLKCPRYVGVDYSKFDLDSTTYKAVIQLASLISEYSASKARLNTANAESNTASDITKNCYITRFFEQINAGTEEDSNAGIKALLSYITQGTENGKENQYSNNPIFFGIKDENGRIIVPGMFTRVGDEYIINKNAKEILNYNLFDGTKNTQSGIGAGYAGMSKLDFFVTQYIAFTTSVGDISNNGINKKIGNLDSSVYAMRIGSDAPKIYMIRAPRYNENQLRYAFYNHLMDEFNMYINGLNKIFKKNNAGEYKLTTSINNLFGRAFYNERTASKIRQSGKKDYSKSFIEEVNVNGVKVKRLTGNIFKFVRLYKVNNYDAAAEIESVLSLYGDANTDTPALFIKDGNTKLKLNKEYINSENSFIKEVSDEQGTRLVLDFNAEQKQKLLNIIDTWMNNVIIDTKERVGDFISAMDKNGIQYSEHMINNYILNSINMNMNYDDMFEGDFKFYNNARDFLKRTKEGQAGGDGYTGYNLTKFDNGKLNTNTYFNNSETIQVKTTVNGVPQQYMVPTYENGKIVERPMTARNGWRAVTIYNTVKPSDVAMDMQVFLEKQFIKEGMNKNEAHNRSVKIAKGYFDNTKINDAQSYITLEEFIRRKYADGTIGQYQDLIAQLLDPNITAKDINLDEINARIQVEKNFYFDKQFDSNTGTFYPRQIKNAEFVLIPKLLPKDSELIKVYEWMRANDIGQLNTAETDKAAKKNIFTIWSEDKAEFIDPNTNKSFNNNYVQNYYYQYLYKQQDVPQHMLNEKNKLGAQISKKIIDNVSTASPEVRQWADEYQAALVENIKEDYVSFLNNMGWEYDITTGHIVNSNYATTDSNGNPLPEDVIKTNRETLNLTNFYSRAREEAARLGMDSNFMEYLIPNEFGVTTMPNIMNNVAAKLESVAQALFNRTITRQTMPGWHAAQITGVGYSKRLHFNAETGVMEVYLPRWSSLLPKTSTPEEEAELIKQIESEGLDIHIGYRIPTEGKQSISVLKVVGFTNEALGSTIVVPDDWVTQTGSDFDVDSVYGICYEMYQKKDKNGKITVHMIPFEEDTIDNKNLYINYINSNINNKIQRSDIGEEIESRIKELRDNLRSQRKEDLAKNNKEFNKIDTERNKLYDELPAWARGLIIVEQSTAKKIAKKNKVSVDLRGEYQSINEKLNQQLEKRTLDEKTSDIIKQYIDYQTALIDIMNEQDGINTFDKNDYISSKKNIIATSIENAKQTQLKNCENVAKEVGLLTYDEFIKLPLINRLNRKARNNYILNRMIKIMNDASSREEQYGRSQFEDIAGEDRSANNIISKISGENKRSRSPYNPLDQLDYFEDAMGGARLKALSVNWDTFVSKCNRTHPILDENNSVKVVLSIKHIEDSDIDYNEENIKKAYPNSIEIENIKQNNETKNKSKSYIVDTLGDTPIWMTDKRIKELQPLVNNVIKDKKVFYIPYRDFIRYLPNKSYEHTYNYIENNQIVKNSNNIDYKGAEVVYDLIDEITGKKPDFVKGQVAVTKSIIDLIQKTSTDEFYAISESLNAIANFNDTINTSKKRELNNNIINSYIQKNKDDGIEVNDEDLNDIIISTYKSNYQLDTLTSTAGVLTVIGEDVINNEELKNKYPKSYNTLLTYYNEENNISTTIDKERHIFTADKIGWSNTNKNIIGNFITTYTAETTAHHLDAVKQGSIPNVNEYTFHVYKFLTTIGLDHEFSVGFIRQPAITKLVANNNLIKSIFFNSKNNPIKMTLADIANQLGLKIKNKYDITHNTSMGAILNILKEDDDFVSYFESYTGINIKELSNKEILNLNIPLDKEMIFNRIKNAAQKGTNKITVSEDRYDIAVQDVIALIQFNKFKNTADILNEYIQALNADKIGASPSIRETRQMRNRINKLRTDNTLTINKAPMIEAIYPVINNNYNSIDIEKSVYASIAAIYACATIPSIDVGGKIFTMENNDFAEVEDVVQSIIRHRFNESEYKEYKRYAVSTLYNEIEKLLTPLSVDKRGRIITYINEVEEQDKELKTASPYWDRERTRIVGYGVTDEGNFKCKDINNPTDEEIREYLKLTPAQKVMFIQRSFPDDQGIFNNIKITLLNNTDIVNRGISRQYLNYDDQVDSIEDLFSMFEHSFSNHNPLIKLAAIDLIKYAFIAEGYNFKSGYITKIIPNDTLYTDVNNGGMDIIDDIKVKSVDLFKTIASEEFINNFIRSHSNFAPLFNLSIKEKTTNIFIACSNIDGLVSFDMMTENTQAKYLQSQLMLERYVGSYIRINHPIADNKTAVTLYKVEGRNPIFDNDGKEKGYKDIYLIPLNLLDKYENYDVSYNQHYNQFNDYSYYIDRIDKLALDTESYRAEHIDKAEMIKNQINNAKVSSTGNNQERIGELNKLYQEEIKISQRARGEAIKNNPAALNPIGNFVPVNNNIFDNPLALTEFSNSSDKYLAGATNKFISDIKKYFIDKLVSGDNSPVFIINQSYQINNLIPEGTAIIQDILNEDGDITRIQIGHSPKTKTLFKTIYDIEHGKNVNNTSMIPAMKQLKETNTKSSKGNYFFISQVPISKEEENNRLNAATELIGEPDTEPKVTPRRGNVRSNIDVVSSSIMKQIQYEAIKNNSDIAKRFVHDMERRQVNRNYRSSLTEHRRDIYRSAARYYQSAANSLLNALNNYEIAGETIPMNTAEFFEKLAKNDFEFNKVAKIILDAVTFGNRIMPIMQLDIATVDKDTQDAIKSIQNSINSVRTNEGFKTALANMFNIYFKKYSTNPDIVSNIINLRDQFGDIDTIVSLISDPAELNNNEVQVILKHIYTMFSKAELFDVENNVKEWREQLANIDAMTESLDMNKIIDSRQGIIRQDFKSNYLEDKQKVIDDFNNARMHKDESQEAFTKYIKAKYARDEFMYKHQHQLIVDDYYKEDLAMRKAVMDNAKDLYYEYMKYTTELYNLNTGEDTDNEDVKKRKTAIINHIMAIRSMNDVGGELKPIQQRNKIKALNDYISAHRELNRKYFDTKEYEGFQEDYNHYNDYIKYYDKTHKRLSLEEKLDDAEYREAYNWIKRNGKLKYTDEVAAKIANAFDLLTKHQKAIPDKFLKAIRKMDGVVDDNGIIDARKLNEEQINQLREEEMNELATKYENGNGEMMLIKAISSRPPIINFNPKDNESKQILMDLKYKDNALKFKIIQSINEILGKAIDADTGEINFAYLFNNNYVTNEDREELAELYKQLRNLRSNTLKKYRKRKNKVYEDVIDEEMYNKARIIYDSFPKHSIQAKQWLDIFTELDGEGNLVPNSNLFGYRIPKKEFIDSDRTAARDFIFDNIEFVPNEYYWKAAEEHKQKGDYDEWFKMNNIYNPYTHKYEPLKVWTTMSAKPDSELAKSIEYIPTFDNMERTLKKEYINPNFKEFSYNYKKGDSKYDTDIQLNAKEKAMKELIQETLNKYATTYQGRKFVGKGFMPRSRSEEVNPRWAAGQLMSLFGISWHSGSDSDSFHDIVDYSHDREADMKMLTLLKGKGTKAYKPSPKRMDYSNDEDYQKDVDRIRKENHQIYLDNLAIDNANLNRDWKKVMEDFIYNATIFNSRQAAKPYLYLLMEDLNNNEAFKVKGKWNKRLLSNSDYSTKDDPQYQTEKQVRTQELIHNLARRLLFDQYHENNVARSIANLLQNITSAKYMVFNLYGGVANITTGKVNIRAEEFANEYFGFREIVNAEKEYLTNVPAFISSRFSDKSPTLAAAFIKQFNVVDFDQILQFSANEGDITERIRNFRDYLYSFQSMGEHYMQNTVLFAMLKSNRLYTDNTGVTRIGDFKDFTWSIEQEAMRNVLSENPELLTNYELYIDSIRQYDLETKLDVTTGRKDINRNFLYSIRNNKNQYTEQLYKDIAKKYHAERNKLLDIAKKKFMSNPTVESLFEFKDGKAVLKKEYIDKVPSNNKIGNLETLISGFREKVKSVNKKIHGVYDKDGAAAIENRWWGSLVMQYHKHLPTGIWKRWRRKGYYSEFRGSRERGTYQTFIDFMGTEFINYKDRIKQQSVDTNIVLSSIQVTFQSVINTLTNIQFNWNNLATWEKANIKRNLGDMAGVLSACLVVAALYGLSDDDDINDDRFKASLLYLADRLYSDSTMFTPVGLVSEYKTAWSSPIASANGPSDFMKAITMIPQYLFDPDYNTKYTTGLYRGQDKLMVLLRRNLPGIRPWDRIQMIDKNNNYYKIDSSQIGIGIAKDFGEILAGE